MIRSGVRDRVGFAARALGWARGISKRWRHAVVRQRLPIGAGLLALAALVGLRLVEPPLVERVRLAVFDAYQRAAPRPYTPLPVRVVDIDDESLARLGQWPWSRRLMARLVEQLAAAGAAVVAFDMVFAEPDRSSPTRVAANLDHPPDDAALRAFLRDLPDYDAEFRTALAAQRTVTGFGLLGPVNDARPTKKAGLAAIGAERLSQVPRFGGAVVNLPAFEAAASGNGSFSILAQLDDTVRRVPLVQRLAGDLVPALSVEALRVAQGERTLKVRAEADGATLRIGRIDVPLDASGSIWLHFTRHHPERYVAAWRLLEPASAAAPHFKAALAGSIVFVGTSAVGLKDLRATPLDPFAAGVEVHAQAAEQMLLGRHLARPTWAAGLEIVGSIGLGLCLILAFAMLPARFGAPLALLAIAAVLAASWAAFGRAGLLLDPVTPATTTALLYVTVSFVGYVGAERERGQIRDAFKQYLAPALVEQLAARPEQLKLGGELRELTFLFTDLAGFTAFVEGSSPERLVLLLNRYLDGACGIVMAHGGTIDKIVGDAVHAIFNAPLDQPDHAARAVRCALALDDWAEGFAATCSEDGKAFGTTRIGVNTGVAVIGNFGGTRRFDYTAHGDAINTAARLESVNKHLGTRICVAGTTAAQCPDSQFRPIGTLYLVGKTIGIETFEPLPATLAGAPAARAYLAAFSQLERGLPEAAAAFAELRDRFPDDPLIRLHARRLAKGETGTAIRLDAK